LLLYIPDVTIPRLKSGFLTPFMTQTILIAATDPNIIYLLQRYAEASGFKVVRCGYEKDLLHLTKQVNPVLIVLEIEQPEAPWRESLKHLKADPCTKHIPVMAYSYYDDIMSSPDDEIASYLQKSVLYTDFVSALEKTGIHPVDMAE
jgi:CheY-like chemotaxis protein